MGYNTFWGSVNVFIGAVNLSLYFAKDQWWFNLFIGILCLVTGIVALTAGDD